MEVTVNCILKDERRSILKFDRNYKVVLKMWRREYMNKEPKNSIPNTQKKESEELNLLRKENKRLKEENAILKKFAAILSKDQELF